MEQQCEKRKYIEYRTGLYKGLFESIGKSTLGNDEKNKRFQELIRNSKDIMSIVIDTSICKTLDDMDGIPKLLITVFSKWAEANYITPNNICVVQSLPQQTQPQ